MKPALTPKQQRFIVEYLKDLNATQAAIRAGYSPNGANRAGPRLLSNVVISQEIARHEQQHFDRAEWQGEDVLRKLRFRVNADIRGFFTPDGNLKPLHELTDEQALCISSYEMVMKNATAGDGKVDRVLKIRLWDAVRCMDLAMQHFKLLSPKVSEEPHVQVSVEVKTLATVLTEPELLLIRERLLERSRKDVQTE